MDLVALLTGIGVVIAYKQSGKRNKLVLFLGIALIIVGLIPFTLGFMHGFKKGFERGFEQAREKAGYHATATGDISEEETLHIAMSISKCWNISKNESSLPIVKLHVLLNPDTSIKTMGVVAAEKARYRSDALYRKTADRAMNALKTCSPLTFLPQGKYALWKDLELTFDPRMDPQAQ